MCKKKETKIPLEEMSLIDMPLKSCAVDVFGQFIRHHYIVTLVDYTTRYPETVPLKNIDTEVVVEALVNIYSRVGVPDEILSDMGTLFVPDCMKQVSRLLGICQLTTSPNHPMCNSLVETFSRNAEDDVKEAMC